VICDRSEGVAIPLGGGVYAVVDAADADVVTQLNWHAMKRAHTQYAVHREPGTHKAILMHRLLMSAVRDELIDHRDGNGLNNRRANLRPATTKQNARNGKAKGKVPYRGVRAVRKAFAAAIWPDDQNVNLGTTFATAEEASAVYNAAAMLLFGSFARPSAVPPDFDALRQVVKRRLNGWQILATALEGF
jgi:hypothetical protein